MSLCAWYFKYAVVPDHDMHSATVESYLLICWAVPGVLQWRDHALLFSRFRFRFAICLFGSGGHCKAATLGVVTCDETSSVLICPWQGLTFCA